MRPRGVLILLLALSAPAWSEQIWTLRSGPEPILGIPLEPVQLVDAWRGRYNDGEETIWVYATRSPNFFASGVAEARSVAGSPWTVVVFYPSSWKPAEREAWWTLWLSDFRSLASLPKPGALIVLPAVLRKD